MSQRKKMTLRLFGTNLIFLIVVWEIGWRLALGKEDQPNPQWSWEQPYARVLSNGDLEWTPLNYQFTTGKVVRYIDYENGNDSYPGTKEKPWKHHPWDPRAEGSAKIGQGVDTYVFKGGVIYRGTLYVQEEGTKDHPIRLTRDPEWGHGEAVLAGSERIVGWKRGTNHPKIPFKEKVWWVDLDFFPRNVWIVVDGEIRKIPLARTPNWRITNFDDIKSEWFVWDNPQKPFGHREGNLHKAFDTQNIIREEDYYLGAYVWTEWGWVMGTPFPTRVEKVNVKEKWMAFKGQWGGPTGEIIRNNRYYLEDKPHYLDDLHGEFWFEKKGNQGGRLYLLLPDEMDPNHIQVEVAKRIHVIQAKRMYHLEISGLTFRFTNVFWDLGAGPWVGDDVEPACIWLRGSGDHITIRNCRFEHVHAAVRMKAVDLSDSIDHVLIDSNVIRFTDHTGLEIEDGGEWGNTGREVGRLFDVKIFRNHLSMIGMRPSRFGQGHALVVDCAETLEVAGNFLEKVWGSGIHVFGAKRSGLRADRPLSRILIHHNKVVDSMLNTNDWGGIETWQGGPAYVYNNLSVNPGGYWHWKYKNHSNEPGCGRFGHAYYLDGAFKNYYFNNIAWGRSKDPLSPLGNTSAFQEIHGFLNTFFNNTVYNFVVGSRRQAPHAGRNKYLGNVWQGIGWWVFRHADPAKSREEANIADAGEQLSSFAYESNAYANNVFFDVAEYGVYEANGRWLKTLDDFRQALVNTHTMVSSLGQEATSPLLKNPEQGDFSLLEDSSAIDAGVKVFVPWGLFRTVGEWHFYHLGHDVTIIPDEHWYMAPYYTDRTRYYLRPTFPLQGVNITHQDYVQGVLEDWVPGALRLNGNKTYLQIPNHKLIEGLENENYSKTPLPKETFDWVEIRGLPDFLIFGQPIKIEVWLKPEARIEKGILQVDLHWNRSGRWIGILNTAGQHTINGLGPYIFTLHPEEKPQLDCFTLTIFVSPDGSWKNHTHIARQNVLPKEDFSLLGPLHSPNITTSSFLIELYAKIDPSSHPGVLIQKWSDPVGYALLLTPEKRIELRIGTPHRQFQVTTPKEMQDGEWHHIITEVDRQQRELRIYVDGRLINKSEGPDTVSLENDADFYVGGTPSGGWVTVTFDFLRIALGTLSDAKTSIEELYAWQFNGPFLKDWNGSRPKGQRRDAGALELK